MLRSKSKLMSSKYGAWYRQLMRLSPPSIYGHRRGLQWPDYPSGFGVYWRSVSIGENNRCGCSPLYCIGAWFCGNVVDTERKRVAEFEIGPLTQPSVGYEAEGGERIMVVADDSGPEC